MQISVEKPAQQMAILAQLQLWSRVVNLTAAASGAQSDIHPPGAVGGLSKLTHVNL